MKLLSPRQPCLKTSCCFRSKVRKNLPKYMEEIKNRDRKTVYVGDSRGRVFSWSVTDNPGRAITDHLVRDESGDSCVACGVQFSFAEQRHHCRNCGQLFCSKFSCLISKSQISRLNAKTCKSMSRLLSDIKDSTRKYWIIIQRL